MTAPDVPAKVLRSKPVAIAGCVLLLSAVVIQGGLDIWFSAQPGWDLPSADRPLRLALRRHSVYLSPGLWNLRQAMNFVMLAGIAAALWGGWKVAAKGPASR